MGRGKGFLGFGSLGMRDGYGRAVGEKGLNVYM